MFNDPQWQWRKATGAPQEGWTLPVDAYDGPSNCGNTRVLVPGEFIHYVLSTHGPDATLDRLQVLVCDGRYYLAYDYSKPHNERGSMVLWYYTPSNMPDWLKEIVS